MMTQRKRYSAEFKARMAFEALKGENPSMSLPANLGSIQPSLPSGRSLYNARDPASSQHGWGSRSKPRKP